MFICSKQSTIMLLFRSAVYAAEQVFLLVFNALTVFGAASLKWKVMPLSSEGSNGCWMLHHFSENRSFPQLVLVESQYFYRFEITANRWLYRVWTCNPKNKQSKAEKANNPLKIPNKAGFFLRKWLYVNGNGMVKFKNEKCYTYIGQKNTDTGG